jgi:hypothetical protein
MLKEIEDFDVAVVGAGPAGMIAAGRAAEMGSKVVLVEKNPRPGRKLLLTGKGRCNITNAESDLRKMTERYGKNGNFLFHALSVFGPKETVSFFEKLGLKTKIERGNRVFPVSDRAADVLESLGRYLSENKVVFMPGSEVVGVVKKEGRIKGLRLKDTEISAKNYILCTGGKSYPKTGSTGEGFKWLEALGHKIEKLAPALTPIIIKEPWVRELQGLSLKNVDLGVFQAGKKQGSEFGECLFTHFGLSGPIILEVSKKVGELLEKGKVDLVLDLKPDKRIQRDFEKYKNKAFKNCLTDLLPRRLIPVVIRLSGIDPEKKANSVKKEERQNLTKLLKSLKMTPDRLLGFEEAIVTSGGVCLKEIDGKTMRSKIISNLFFAGEIIDIDGPSGGFNLQNCWSTGYLAGQSASV